MKKWLATFFRDRSIEGSRFRAGIILILASFPVSWASALAGAEFYSSNHAWFGLAVGFAVYAFSWVLFLMGFWAARRRGLVMARKLWRTLTDRKKRHKRRLD